MEFGVGVFDPFLYLRKYVQATFYALSKEEVRGATLVVSGNGSNFSKASIQIIIKMAAANGVSHTWVGQNGLLSVAAASAIWVGQNGLLSVAAASAVVRGRVGHEESKASGAFILTGRHYPRGPHEDFGIKYMMENGGPAPEAITGKIYENMETIREVLIAEDLSDVDLSVISITSFASRGRQFYVEVFDSAYDYVELMKSIFDFKSIRKLLSSPKFTFCYDALHGVAGPYVKRIFLEELGADESSLMDCVCKEDFGGRHLDPGLTYASASELLARMGLGKRSSQDEPPLFGAATDGDANHNMIVGKGFSLVHLIPLLLLLQMLLKPYLTFLVVLRDLPGA